MFMSETKFKSKELCLRQLICTSKEESVALFNYIQALIYFDLTTVHKKLIY